MKKIILIAVIAMVSKFSEAQVSLGLHVGANFGMGKLKYNETGLANIWDTYDQKNKMKVGVLGGFMAEIPVGSSLAFRPELNFLQEGTKHTFTGKSGIEYSGVQKITLNYIQLPLNVIYKVPAGGGNAFFGLGPVVQFGLSGKDKFTSSTVPSQNEDFTIKFDGKKSEGVTDPAYYEKKHLKSVDVGINVLAGYKLGMGVFVQLGYSHGFIDISPDKDDPDVEDRFSYKNSGFNISVGYMIGGGGTGKKKK